MAVLDKFHPTLCVGMVQFIWFFIHKYIGRSLELSSIPVILAVNSTEFKPVCQYLCKCHTGISKCTGMNLVCLSAVQANRNYVYTKRWLALKDNE